MAFTEKRGLNCSSGVIHYPASMRKVDVEWENADDLKLEQVLKEISAIIVEPTPPQVHKRKMCSRCAYFDFCYA